MIAKEQPRHLHSLMLDHEDSGAGNDEPVRTITQGDLRKWIDRAADLYQKLDPLRQRVDLICAETDPEPKIEAAKNA